MKLLKNDVDCDSELYFDSECLITNTEGIAQLWVWILMFTKC